MSIYYGFHNKLFKKIIPFYWNLCAENATPLIIQKKFYCTTTRVVGINKWDREWTSELQKEIEEHWMNRLQENRFDENSDKDKFYILSMFPYPSGNLHMGHVRVYSIGDTFARYHRLKKRNVIHPMGWDAFGLPAENAALERNLDPRLWTRDNIAHMKSLMKKLNLSFDWDRELVTCNSDYYKWTQFLFLKLYEKDLVYRREAFVNWDPVDETVLADEQVTEDGRSWRSGAVVEKKLMTQWFIRTTRYSESLRNGLKDPVLEDWTKVIKQQLEWIGHPNGTTFDFEVVENESNFKHKFVTVWMSKPEYVREVKFIAVEPQSVWCSDGPKSGILAYKVKNPISGEVIPVYATDSVRFEIGRDNHAGVPEYEAEDKEFADSVNLSYVPGNGVTATEEELVALRKKMCEKARELGVGGYPINSKARDWLISRQRYWGTPIPVVHCPTCGVRPVPKEELPVKLPELPDIRKGKNVLLEAKDWLETKCPECGGHALRETDTMDTFVDSSWYFLRYLDPKNESAPFREDKLRRFMPVNLYVGGREHATLHLYYARFISHFLHSLGLLPHREPFKRLLAQGIVRGKTYRVKRTGEYVKPESVDSSGDSPVHKDTGEELDVSWEKMSKSKHNGVEPQELLERFGSDTTRLIILGDVGPWSPRNWNEDTIQGPLRWQKRLWSLMVRFREARNRKGTRRPDEEALAKMNEEFFDHRNYAVDMVGHSLEVTLNVHMAITKMQSLTNALCKTSEENMIFGYQFERTLATFIILLAPFAPCFASEMWSGFVTAPNRIASEKEVHWDKAVFQQVWPTIDDGYVSKFTVRKGTAKSRYEKLKREQKKDKNSKSESDTKETGDERRHFIKETR